MANGKISQFLKSNWRTILFAFALFAGVLCGVWACSKSSTVTIDAYRPRINVEQPKTK